MYPPSAKGLIAQCLHLFMEGQWVYLLLPVRGRVDKDVEQTGPIPVTQTGLQSAAQLLHRPDQEPLASEGSHDLIITPLWEQGHRRDSEEQYKNVTKTNV